MEGCTDLFLLRGEAVNNIKKSFSISGMYSVLDLLGNGTNPWIGSFSLVKQKKPKKRGGGCTDRGSPSRRPRLQRSLSLPSFSFCWIETTHWGPLIDRTELLGFTTQAIPSFKKKITHRTVASGHATLHLESRRKWKKEIKKEIKKERKKFMRKLQTANCKLHSQSLTSNEQYWCCLENDLLSWVGEIHTPPSPLQKS